MEIIDCISDLHGHFPKLEGGDLLIIAGDLTARDKCTEHSDFCDWLDSQPYKKKIVIAGNHDNNIEADLIECLHSTYYLEDNGTNFERLKIWGTPWSLSFHGINPHCKAFMGSESDLKKKYDLIPSDIDILVTHSPPFGILDECENGNVGSKSLRDVVLSAERFPNLKAVIFGHIHEQGGKIFETNLCKFINCSIMNEHYKPINKPMRITL